MQCDVGICVTGSDYPPFFRNLESSDSQYISHSSATQLFHSRCFQLLFWSHTHDASNLETTLLRVPPNRYAVGNRPKVKDHFNLGSTHQSSASWCTDVDAAAGSLHGQTVKPNERCRATRVERETLAYPQKPTNTHGPLVSA